MLDYLYFIHFEAEFPDDILPEDSGDTQFGMNALASVRALIADNGVGTLGFSDYGLDGWSIDAFIKDNRYNLLLRSHNLTNSRWSIVVDQITFLKAILSWFRLGPRRRQTEDAARRIASILEKDPRFTNVQVFDYDSFDEFDAKVSAKEPSSAAEYEKMKKQTQ